MSRPTLAAYTYTRNCVRIRYPFRESVLSALALADAVYWCDCHSDDGTWEQAQEMARHDPRLRVMQHPWGDHYSIQPRVCNGILEAIGTGYEFAFLLQADEVACEWTEEPFRRELRDAADRGFAFAAPHYTHFCPDFRTTFPFIYDRKAVVHRTASGARWDTGGDACSLVGPGVPVYGLNLEVFHYGKVEAGRAAAALAKELSFQALYKDKGFPDPWFTARAGSGAPDYRGAFAAAPFAAYGGPHPAVMADWIRRAEANP